jgi:hypothetical protein
MTMTMSKILREQDALEAVEESDARMRQEIDDAVRAHKARVERIIEICSGLTPPKK